MPAHRNSGDRVHPQWPGTHQSWSAQRRSGLRLFGIDCRPAEQARLGTMNTATAPSQLPFVPRPFAEELFSSWMLRVANANCVSLQELVLGFQSRHPDVPGPNVLDWCLPDGFLKAISRFSRTPIGTLHALDLRARLPTVQTALLLLGQAVSDQSQR